MWNDHAAFAEGTRATLLKMPRVSETMQWGGLLVYWVLDRAVGGKIFAILNPEPADDVVLAFAAGPERAPELLEVDGVRPAPHLARAHWVALTDWQVLGRAQMAAELQAAHDYVERRLPPRVQRLGEMSAAEYRALVREKAAAVKLAEAKKTAGKKAVAKKAVAKKADPGARAAKKL